MKLLRLSCAIPKYCNIFEICHELQTKSCSGPFTTLDDENKAIVGFGDPQKDFSFTKYFMKIDSGVFLKTGTDGRKYKLRFVSRQTGGESIQLNEWHTSRQPMANIHGSMTGKLFVSFPGDFQKDL
jgi:hypothetical protein